MTSCPLLLLAAGLLVCMPLAAAENATYITINGSTVPVWNAKTTQNATWAGRTSIAGKLYIVCDPNNYGTLSGDDPLTGHARGDCYSGTTIKDGNGTEFKANIVGCYHPYGWMALPSVSTDAACNEARCVYGATTGCAHKGPWTIILVVVTMMLLVVYLSMFIFTLYMLAGLKKHGNLSCNAQVSTIITTSIALFFCCLWLPNYTFDITRNGDKAWSINMMNPIAIPGSALFMCIAALNLSLMWSQVAASAKAMKKGSQNLDKKSMYAVIAISVTFGLLMVLFFAILGNNTLGSAVALVFFVVMAVSYLVGSFRLAAAMTTKGEKPKASVLKIIGTARKVCAGFFIVVLNMLAYSALRIVKRNSPVIGALETCAIIGVLVGTVIAGVIMIRYVAGNTAKNRGIKIAKKTARSFGAAVTTTGNTTTGSTVGSEAETATVVEIGSTKTEMVTVASKKGDEGV